MKYAIIQATADFSVLLTCGTEDTPAVHPWASSMGDEIRYHTAAEAEVLSAHPLLSYEDVEDIDAMAEIIRKARPGQSFSRDWWKWDRLLARYIAHGREDKNVLKILRAVFVGGIFNRYHALKAKGEADLLHIFFLTRKYPRITEGYPRFRGPVSIDGRMAFRELHGGCGPHAGWGGAARMRIYEELVKEEMLTQEEQELFRKIVHQSFSDRFIDFDSAPSAANNHAFGNVGGIDLALRLFPDVPQAKEAQAWLDRTWKNLTELSDWKEWTYNPYGIIFLHGLVDYAENGRLETDEALIYALGRRCLGFIHSGGVRGNPNSGAAAYLEPPAPDDSARKAIYENPWQNGYYPSGDREGHFWYRMAEIFKEPEFLWAAEQVILGGRPPNGEVSMEYLNAYDERFKVFNDMGIKPSIPAEKSVIGYFSPLKHQIPERLYLHPDKESGKPFVSYFLYDGGGSHLCRNGAGRLYEYGVDGVKYLGTAGKYTGGVAGQAGWDMLLVTEKDCSFPLNEQGKSDSELSRGGKMLRDAVKAENRDNDSFGQFTLVDCFESRSRWTRQTVLTEEGYLIVRDTFEPDGKLDGFQIGPCWMLRTEGRVKDKKYINEPVNRDSAQNWFDAPAWDYSWWQRERRRITVYIHPSEGLVYGTIQQETTADISREIRTNNSFAKGTIKSGRISYFLSVLVPHDATEEAEIVVGRIKTKMSANGAADVKVGNVEVSLSDARWSVKR